MAVTKLPRMHQGMLRPHPPVSWPNDTAIGRRRPRHGLLKQAIRNRQQVRIANLSAGSNRSILKPTHNSSLRSQAPRFSDQSRHRFRQSTHHSTHQSKGSESFENSARENKKPPLRATQLPDPPKVSSNSLTEKKHAKFQMDKHIGISSLPSSRSKLTLAQPDQTPSTGPPTNAP